MNRRDLPGPSPSFGAAFLRACRSSTSGSGDGVSSSPPSGRPSSVGSWGARPVPAGLASCRLWGAGFPSLYPFVRRGSDPRGYVRSSWICPSRRWMRRDAETCRDLLTSDLRRCPNDRRLASTGCDHAAIGRGHTHRMAASTRSRRFVVLPRERASPPHMKEAAAGTAASSCSIGEERRRAGAVPRRCGSRRRRTCTPAPIV